MKESFSRLWSLKGKHSDVIRLDEIAIKIGHLSEQLKTQSKHSAIATLFKNQH